MGGTKNDNVNIVLIGAALKTYSLYRSSAGKINELDRVKLTERKPRIFNLIHVDYEVCHPAFSYHLPTYPAAAQVINAP